MGKAEVNFHHPHRAPSRACAKIVAMPSVPSSPTPPGEPLPTVALTMGDPLGVGPEIVVKALSDPKLRRRARFVVYGMAEPMHYAADLAEIEPYWRRVQHDSPIADTAIGAGVTIRDYDEYTNAGSPGRTAPSAGPSRLGGHSSFRFVEDAIFDSARDTADPLRVDAIVTAPICKESWNLAGRGRFPGHTELLALRYRVRRSAMMFVSPTLKVVLVSAHVPLMELRNALTIGRIFDPIDLANDAMRELGFERPRIAVCGLNPHAGEGGLLGDEEERLIKPAIRVLNDAGIDARGPFPADTIFSKALAGEFDLVAAMYHDQGLIPIKLLEWKRAVNVTLGLPVIRTSPDHGTAFDIAGKNAADESSMTAAIELALDLTLGRRTRAAQSAMTTER